MASSRRSRENQALILLLARAEVAKFSQSRDGRSVRVSMGNASQPSLTRGLNVAQSPEELPTGNSVASYFLRLQHLDPGEAATTFWSHLGLNKFGRITPVTSPPGLLITENSENIRQILRVAVILDVPQGQSGLTTEFYALKYADAVVIGFGVKLEGKAVKTAKAEGIQVKLYSIIYELIDQVKEAMLGLLDPETREKVIGHAQVKQVFKIQRGRVGGCVVTDGRISRTARARVLRGRQAVYDGGFQTLRRFQDDVQEVRNGLECGIRLGDFNEYEPGDVIECYELEKIAQSL
jgi:hypothetical protein